MKELLYQKAKEIGIELDSHQLDQFEHYYHILIETNKVMNLTAITDEEEVIDKHFIDSLSVVRCMDLEKAECLIDVGTGAGFPGIPLKIVFPHLKVTLLDSLNKRVNFLNQVINKLMFDKINAVHARAEDAARDRTMREAYDLCVSRAVADLSVLCEYCLPFVKVGGTFVSYKSKGAADEVKKASKAIKVLGGGQADQYPFELPGTDLSRTLVRIEKTLSTPRKYPRKAGTPSKTPIR